jgi:hypothetical protein
LAERIRQIRSASIASAQPRIVAEYDYRDESGSLLYQVVRFEPKDFRQRRPKEGGGWKWTTKECRKVLYRLPELIATPATEIVCIVEGEKDADNLAALGFAATCNVGGAGKWRLEHGEPLRGRFVAILADNDVAGSDHAEHVADAILDIAARVKVIDLPGLPDKGDVSDWIAAGGTREELLELIQHAPDWTSSTAAPPQLTRAAEIERAIPEGRRNRTLFQIAFSLRRWDVEQESIEAALTCENERRCKPPLPKAEVQNIARSVMAYPPDQAHEAANSLIDLISLRPPVLGDAALHGFVGDYVRAIAPYTEATCPGILAHLLPAVGMIVGPKPHVWGGNEQPARLNTVLVGPTSSGRKGTSLVPVDLLMKVVDRQLWTEQKVKGLSSGEGLIVFVADEKYIDENGEEQVRPKEKRVYVVEEEFSKVLANTLRDTNILSQIMREAFDSGDLQKLTVESRRAQGAHICIVGHITRRELLARFSEIEMANGFGNRFLWFVVKSDKDLPDAPRIPHELIREFAYRLRDVVAFAHNKEGLKRDDHANELWKTVYSYLKSDKPGLQGAMLARGGAIVLRLSLIYALLDKSAVIEKHHLEAALAVWEYSEQSVRLLFSEKTGGSLSDKILTLLTEGPMQTSEFYRHILKDAKEIQAALLYLESIGRVRKTKLSPSGRGRPAIRWERIEPEAP